jgi:hypothetical protein
LRRPPDELFALPLLEPLDFDDLDLAVERDELDFALAFDFGFDDEAVRDELDREAAALRLGFLLEPERFDEPFVAPRDRLRERDERESDGRRD